VHGKPEGTIELSFPPKHNTTLLPAYLDTFSIPKYLPINFFATRQKTIDTLAVRGVAQFRGMIVSLIACLELFLVFNLKWTLLSDIEESMKEYFTPHTGHETYFEDASMLGRTSTLDFLACEYI
jgi:hypothetical protein